MEILKTLNIVKQFENHKALSEVSINVEEGSVFGLLGPNGAGKTTLIRIINQITAPDKGEVFLFNEKLKPEHIKNIGYLPEERGLYKKMKVGEQALYFAQLKGMNKYDAKKKLKQWFEKFDILSWYDKKVEELSKGMQQKVQFIITVIHEPKLLIFDEPFSGFDPINVDILKKEILTLKEKGASVIFSTHNMASVEEVCDRIALINKSKKILDGKLVDIKKQFKTNTFQVGLLSDDKLNLRKEIEAKYNVKEASFKSLNDELKLNIQLKNGEDTRELVHFLNQKGSISHFVEMIPSVNDIFIKAIKNNS
ncbi:MAG: ATP-binding cassette domain-containing protein [Bacteroidales bacterium]|nr:ATP-binding cassette domain-containing protein [Bacteroidales bacterium]